MSLMTASREDICWASGLFEGEGNIAFGTNTVRLQLGTTDEDVARKFHSIVGVGSIVPVRSRQPHHKQLFNWYAAGHHNTQAVLAAMWPFLGRRRQSKATDAIKYGATLRPYGNKRRSCKYGHFLSEENTYLYLNRKLCRLCREAAQREHKKRRRTQESDIP